MTIIIGGEKRIRKILPPLDQIIHIAPGVNKMKFSLFLGRRSNNISSAIRKNAVDNNKASRPKTATSCNNNRKNLTDYHKRSNNNSERLNQSE